MSGEIATDAYRKYRRWSRAADAAKSRLAFWRTTAFVLGIIGAFLQTLATQVPKGEGDLRTAVAVLGALCLGAVPLIAARFLTAEKARGWVRSRSASEGIKSELYTYLAAAKPYDDPSAADARLHAEVGKIEDAMDDLVALQAGIETTDRKPPGPLSPEAYIEKRVRDQAEGYYRPRAGEYRKKARRLRGVEFGLALLATALGVLAGIYGDSVEILGWPLVFGVWVAVLTTIGGAITSHIGANRYDGLVTSYLGTARRLEDLATQWPPEGGGAAPSPEWSSYVQRCEAAISTENQGWMARWTKSD